MRKLLEFLDKIYIKHTSNSPLAVAAAMLLLIVCAIGTAIIAGIMFCLHPKHS
jgi:hypothetical protein